MYFSQTLCHPLAFAPNSLFTFAGTYRSFVVDLHKLDDPVDVRADENVECRKAHLLLMLACTLRKERQDSSEEQ